MDSSEKKLALGLFQIIERILLFLVVLMTLGGVAFELHSLYVAQSINLADILLMFLYLEVIGMVAVFYSDRRSASVFPIFIAPTDHSSRQGYGTREHSLRSHRDSDSCHCSVCNDPAQPGSQIRRLARF